MQKLVMHHCQLLISQRLKVLLTNLEELTSMNLILIHWNLILDCVVGYEIMILINKMKFDELTLKMVRIDLMSQSTQNLDKKITFVAFNLRGTSYFLQGLNIHVIKIQYFVCHAFYLVSHLGILRNVYSL
jgi:hypothetical protein